MTTNNSTNTSNPSGVSANSYTSANITVNAAGLITAASNGGGPPGGASLVYLSELTASNSTTLDFTSIFSSSYNAYEIFFTNVLPATSGAILYMLLGTGGTPTYASTGYQWQDNGAYSVSDQNSRGNVNDSQFQIAETDTFGASNSSTYGGVNGKLNLFGTNAASNVAAAVGIFGFEGTSGLNQTVVVNSNYIAAATYTAMRFKFSSGNITSGRIAVYGISNS